MKTTQRVKRLGVYLGVFLFGVAVSLTPTDSPVEAQSPVAADAIEYGISLGLPPAWAYRVSWCESRWRPDAYNRWSGAERPLPVHPQHMGLHTPRESRLVSLRPLRQCGSGGVALPPRRARPLELPVMEGGALCDLCWHEPQYLGRDHLRPPAEVVYTDALGFRYALCGAHRRSVVEGLRRASARRLVARGRGRPPPRLPPTHQGRTAGRPQGVRGGAAPGPGAGGLVDPAAGAGTGPPPLPAAGGRVRPAPRRPRGGRLGGLGAGGRTRHRIHSRWRNRRAGVDRR